MCCSGYLQNCRKLGRLRKTWKKEITKLYIIFNCLELLHLFWVLGNTRLCKFFITKLIILNFLLLFINIHVPTSRQKHKILFFWKLPSIDLLILTKFRAVGIFLFLFISWCYFTISFSSHTPTNYLLLPIIRIIIFSQLTFLSKFCLFYWLCKWETPQSNNTSITIINC